MNSKASKEKKEESKLDIVRERMEAPAIREIFESILVDRTNVSGWIASSLEAARRTKDVDKADPESTIGALITVANMGLRLEGNLGQAYLTVLPIREFDGQRRQWVVMSYQTQVQIGYLGLIRMALRNREVQDCEAREIRSDDKVTFRFGSKQGFSHTWELRRPRGEMIAVYAGLRYKNGYYKQSDPYSISMIEDVQERALLDRGIIAKRDGEGRREWYKTFKGQQRKMKPEELLRVPWIEHFRAMALKTAIRLAAKFWNVGETFDQASSLVALDDSGVSQDLAGVTQQYMGGARRITPPQAPDEIVDGVSLPNPIAGKTGEALRAQMVAEATDAPPDGDITAEEAAEILAQERAEAEAFRLSMEHGEDD